MLLLTITNRKMHIPVYLEDKSNFNECNIHTCVVHYYHATQIGHVVIC